MRLCDVRAAKCLWILAWGPWIIIFLVYSIVLLSYPYEWEPGEGSKIFYAERVLENKPVYGTNQEFPMLGNCYPPLYTLVTAAVIKVTGPYLFAGRLISVVSIIVMLIGLYRVARMITGSPIWALVAAACFVFPAPIANWYSLARMDSLCSLLLFATAYIIFRKPNHRASAFFAGLTAVAALYTKQTAVFVVGMIFLYYLAKKKWKDAVLYAGTVSILSGILFVLCNVLTDGWFYRNLFSENAERVFFAQRYPLFFGWIFDYNLWIWIFAGIALAWTVFLGRWDVWCFYLMGGLMNALLIGANGSGLNYFFTFWSGMSLFFAQGLAYVEKFLYPAWIDTKKFGKVFLIIALLILTSINFLDNSPGFFYRHTLLEYMPTKKDRIAMSCIEEYIKRAQGNIFVDRFPSIAMRYNKNQYYMEPAFIQELYHAGKWNPFPLIRMVASQKFSLILLLSESLVPRPIKEAISQYYLPSEQIRIPTFEVWRNTYITVYRPRGRVFEPAQ